ncbi:hypothetical protein EI94DRAFT_1604014, partial [Lactarius quietus]
FLSLKFTLQNSVGQISFTADTWSDQNRQSFLAITAHWITKVGGTTNLQLKLALITFHHLVGHQTGELLAKVILVLLDRAGVTKKVNAKA